MGTRLACTEEIRIRLPTSPLLFKIFLFFSDIENIRINSKKEKFMSTGKVKWFDPVKGYGFAEIDGQDVFLHVAYVLGEITLKKGTSISCEVVEGLKGFKAKNIKLA